MIEIDRKLESSRPLAALSNTAILPITSDKQPPFSGTPRQAKAASAVTILFILVSMAAFFRLNGYCPYGIFSEMIGPLVTTETLL
ncbi:MAG: hypothetical protein CL693_05470 [Cellvibrionaceae bacterium]|nr:hypothetical protein [Cellvibrionaceae bacterium]|tara:strand:- start:150 stop:404 length:255 start_codon:yes stop_codon:yes gene_type:complete